MLSDNDDHLPPHLKEYERECAAYLARMSPAQIARAKSLGLLKEVRKNGRPTGEYVLSDTGRDRAVDVCADDDAAVLFENSAAHSTPELATAAADRLPDLLAEKFALTSEQARGIVEWHQERLKAEVAQETSTVLQRVIGFFLLADNAKLAAHALAHAARMAKLTGFSSLRKSAEAIGVSPEGIRKVAWKWVELLGLPPLEGAKSAEARAAYSEDKKTNHWRNRPCTMENLSATGATPAPAKTITTTTR